MNHLKSYLKTYWKKIVLIILSFGFIWVGFDYLLGSSVIQQKSSNLFTISYILLFSYIIVILPKKSSIVVYCLSYIPLFFVSIVQYFYFNIIGTFFGIVDTNNANEGLSFINYIGQHININSILFIIIGIIVFVLTIVIIAKTKHIKTNKKSLLLKLIGIVIILAFSIFIHRNAVESLGKHEKDNMWFEGNSYRNIYEKFNIRNVCMQMCGIYEYTIRDIYLYVTNNISPNVTTKIKEINKYFDENERTNDENKYTGVLKDQNLVIIQLEGIDTWMVNSDTMPTLLYLMEHGLNFTDRYAPNFGGGRTQNTEYAINTGLYIPVNGYNIYNSYKNNFKYSLPNLFKESGYTANSIHFNYGYFYSRETMHKAFGYDNHYSLLDLNIGDGYDYWYNDENLAENDDAYKLIIPNTDNKFLSFVITMSAHGSFDSDYPICEDLTSEDCVYKSANRTDNFLTRLLQRMEKDNVLDNTTLILISDHYAYSYNNQEIRNLKNIPDDKKNGEIDRVPFVIWNNSIPHEEIDTLMDTADILPTIANMFDLKVDSNFYLGTDVFSSDHENFVYFKDYSYISENNDKNLSKSVSKKIEINDNMIIANYYNRK